MGNLAHYRTSVILVTLGLLFVVTQVVGDGKKAGAIDVAAKLIVKRLNSAPRGESPRTEPHQAAVIKTDVNRGNAWFETGNASEPAAAAAVSTNDSPALPPPDPSMIHK